MIIYLFFSNEDITSTEAYHRNGPLASLGRVTAANAVLGVEIMPAHERSSPTSEPTGWNQRRYARIGAGGWLYNRSHLIGFQLSGNDDYENLMTGTRWFNMRMAQVLDYKDQLKKKKFRSTIHLNQVVEVVLEIVDNHPHQLQLQNQNQNQLPLNHKQEIYRGLIQMAMELLQTKKLRMLDSQCQSKAIIGYINI